MFYRKIVREAYQEAIALNVTIDAELKAALRAHERVPAFIDNLALEIEKVAALRQKRGKRNLDEKIVKEMVYDVTAIFIAGLQTQAKRNFESDMERIAREQALQKQKDLEQTAEGNISGDYEEFGIIHMTEERSILDGLETQAPRTQN